MDFSELPRKYSAKAFLLIFSLLFSLVASAEHSAEKEAFNPGEMIMHHVQDAYDWHLYSSGGHHYSIPLPIILYAPDNGGLKIFSSSNFHASENHAENPAHAENSHDNHAAHNQPSYEGYTLNHHGKIEALDGHKFYNFSITKNVASMFISVAALLIIFIGMANAYKKKGLVPTGMRSFFEPIILFVRDDVAKPNIGAKYEKFMPYLLTVFFFIWFNNLLGLIPSGANLTGNIAVTLVLAVFTFIVTNINGTKDYWGHVFNMPGVPLPLKPLMAVIEFIGLFTKPFALMVRLFANIFAGHVIILSLISLTFMFQSYMVGGISTLGAAIMFCLELFVAILQAYVFTLLSAVFIGAAVEEHGHHDEAHAEGAHASHAHH